MIKTRILVNGSDLDLMSDVSIPLTYNIADIRNPEQRNGHYSKQVIVPGTAANNKIFSHLWDLTVSVSSSGDTNYNLGFDPNLKATVIVMYEGSIIFEGFLQLNRIVQSHLGYKHDYEITLSSQIIDLYTSMGEKTLADLDFSEYDHTYNITEQQTSWQNTIRVNGVSTPFSKGMGYVYPMIDYGMNNDVDYNVTNFFPAFYIKTIYDKIVNDNGFQVSSSFMAGNYWKSLIFPFTGDSLKLSTTQILNRTFRAEATSDTFSYSSGTTQTDSPLAFTDDSTGLNHDDGNIYNTGTYIGTISHSGTYKVSFSFDIELQHYPTTSPDTTTDVWLCYYLIKRYNPTTGLTSIISSVPVYGTSTGLNPPSNSVAVTVGSPVTTGQISGTGSGVVIGISPLAANDQIYCEFRDIQMGSLYSGGGHTKMILKSGSYFECVLQDTTIMENDTVDMSSVLPSTIKQKDFVSSINRIYNLYYEADKNNINKFWVEPRNDFYSSGTTRDWTYKLDEGRDLESIPMGELDSKTFLWTWKQDTDNFNKTYFDKWAEVYGQKKYNITNDFLKETKKNEVIFSPSPLVDRAGSDRVLTRIYQVNNGVVTPKPANPRILYYGGVLTTQFPWNHIASTGTTVMSTYAYAGHLDSVSSPTVDVNFGAPREVYYTATTYTNNNLFNVYWKQFIDEITDKDSKIVKGYFHLSPVDIEQLSFRDTYFFRNENFRLNKIYDYNPIETEPTLCEFIKIKDGIPFTQTTKAVKGGSATDFDSIDFTPRYNERIMQGGNVYGSDAIVRGENNIVDPTAKGIIISGNRNSISANCENVSLVASSGCSVLANVRNVSLINCTGLTIDQTDSGKTFIENVENGSTDLIYTENDYTATASDNGKLVIFNLTANRVLNLPESADIDNGYTIGGKLNTATANRITVTIVDATQSWGTGDGTTATTHLITTTEVSRKYVFRNNVWHITL